MVKHEFSTDTVTDIRNHFEVLKLKAEAAFGKAVLDKADVTPTDDLAQAAREAAMNIRCLENILNVYFDSAYEPAEPEMVEPTNCNPNGHNLGCPCVDCLRFNVEDEVEDVTFTRE